MCDGVSDFLSDKFYDIWTLTSIGEAVKTFRTEFWKFYLKGSFSKKTQKLLTKFSGLATSGHRNYAAITDCRKFATKCSPNRMSNCKLEDVLKRLTIVLMMSATGYLPTVSNSTPTIRRCFGLGHVMAQPCLAVQDRLCSSEIKSLQRLTMSVF